MSDVKRGENTGRKLYHINVVRDFKTVEVNNSRSRQVIFTLSAGLNSKDVKVIAYLQDMKRKIITGASSVSFN